MCAGWTSKLCLGVAVCAAVVLDGGCQSGRVDSSAQTEPVGLNRPDRGGLALADASAVRRPSLDAAVIGDAPAVGEPPAPPMSRVSESDVIAWVARGTNDEVILDRLQRASNAIRLTAGDEMRLRDAGATDEVIAAIKATAWN